MRSTECPVLVILVFVTITHFPFPSWLSTPVRVCSLDCNNCREFLDIFLA